MISNGAYLLYTASVITLRILPTALFSSIRGHWRSEIDRYKFTWELYLHWPGIDGDLCLYDYKGTPTASFAGSEKGKLAALQRIEWQVGDNIPHPYDYVLAGAVA